MKWFFREKKTESQILWERLLTFDLTRGYLELIIRDCPEIAEAAFEIWVKEAAASDLMNIMRCDNKAIGKRASQVVLERFPDNKRALLEATRYGGEEEAEKAADLFVSLASDEELVEIIDGFDYWRCCEKATLKLLGKDTPSQYLRYAIRSSNHGGEAWQRVKVNATIEDLAWVACRYEDLASEAINLLLSQENIPINCLKAIAQKVSSKEVFERVWSALPKLALEELTDIVDDVYGNQPIKEQVWECILALHPSDKELFKIIWDSFQLRVFAWDEVKTHPNLDPHALAFVIDRQNDLREEAWRIMKKQPMTKEKALALFSVMHTCAYGVKFDGLEAEMIRALLKHDLDAKSYRKIIDYTECTALKELATRKLMATKEGILERLLKISKQQQ